MVEKALFLFFLLLPFQFALNPVEGVDLAIARVVAIGIAGLFLLERLHAGSWKIPRSGALFAMMGFFLLAALSFSWSIEPAWSVRKFFFLLSFLPLWFVIVDTLYRGGERSAIFLSQGFFFGAVSMAIIALLQFFSQFIFSFARVVSFFMTEIYPIFLGGTFSQSVAIYPSLLVNIGGETILRATGAFPDPHVAAFYFGMAVPFGLWLGLLVRKEKRVLFLSGTAILLLADLCTFSRGGYMGLLALAGFFTAFMLYHYRKEVNIAWKKNIFFGIIVVFVFGIIVPPARERLIDTFSLTEGSNRARIILWQEAGEHIANRPWLGYGLGNYPLAVKPSADYREPIYIHNTYLDIWAELGIVGFVFFLLVFFLPVGIFFFRGSFSSIAFPAFLAMTLFLGHSIFENVIFSVHIIPILLFLITILSWHNERVWKQNI